jgi:flagellar hook-associated protein 1 FlgK
LVQELAFRSDSVSGVNIDEELRNLVIYENAYAATARIIQVADDLFEKLLNITG